MAKFIIYCSELIMTTMVKFWLHISGRLIENDGLADTMHYNTRYLYVANHSSYLDPIVMWSVLGMRQRLNGAPTKVMTTASVYYSFIKPVIWLLGAFPAKPRHRDTIDERAGIPGALRYLSHGYNICIFPEGKRAREDEHRAFSGVSRILEASDDCTIILIHIVWHHGPWWRRKLELRAARAPETIDRRDPHAIMRAIYNL